MELEPNRRGDHRGLRLENQGVMEKLSHRPKLARQEGSGVSPWARRRYPRHGPHLLLAVAPPAVHGEKATVRYIIVVNHNVHFTVPDDFEMERCGYGSTFLSHLLRLMRMQCC